MTYSYYLRRWAMDRMNENLLGRDAIALVCGVAPRTISSWARADSGLGPYLLLTPRESDRAIAFRSSDYSFADSIATTGNLAVCIGIEVRYE